MSTKRTMVEAELVESTWETTIHMPFPAPKMRAGETMTVVLKVKDIANLLESFGYMVIKGERVR